MQNPIIFRQDGYPETEPRICDICRLAACSVYCKDKSAYLCHCCVEFIHANNPTASSHHCVWICNACENAQATIICQAHGATLCADCDNNVHLANLLTGCHNRSPLPPFPGTVFTPSRSTAHSKGSHNPVLDVDNQLASGLTSYEELENELKSWFLFDPDDEHKKESFNSWDNSSSSMEYQDQAQEKYYQNSSIHQRSTVLAQLPAANEHRQQQSQLQFQQKQDRQQQQQPIPPALNHRENIIQFDASLAAYIHTRSTQTKQVCKSSLEPSNTSTNAKAAVSSSSQETSPKPVQLRPFPLALANREAKVLRYREKKKARQFENKIRYPSRKTNAQNRPRVKGRFVGKSDPYFNRQCSSHRTTFTPPSFHCPSQEQEEEEEEEEERNRVMQN